MSIDPPELPPPRRRYWLDALIILCLAAGLSFILLWQTIFVLIPPGYVGVLYRLFGDGTDTTTYLPEGLAMKWPWNIIYLYEARIQSRDQTTTALSVSGLSVKVDFTALYAPDPALIGDLHRRVGPEYFERRLLPNLIEAVREVVGEYDPHALYTVSAEEMSDQILASARRNLDDPAIELRDIVVRQVTLPEELNEAITRKLTQEQIAQTYKFRLEAEEREAERKRIEAIGIKTFYAIVSDALTPALLTWRGIEATVELAHSSNSKVVIVGGGKDQLPLILGSDIATVPPSTPLPQVPSAKEPALPDINALPPLFPNAASQTMPAPATPAPTTPAPTTP
ncbi:MAG: prohibitin family protein [Geminicoccaceae bacterium]